MTIQHEQSLEKYKILLDFIHLNLWLAEFDSDCPLAFEKKGTETLQQNVVCVIIFILRFFKDNKIWMKVLRSSNKS